MPYMCKRKSKYRKVSKTKRLQGLKTLFALVAQGIEQWFPVPRAGGSNPSGCIEKQLKKFTIFQLLFVRKFVKILLQIVIQI